MHEHRVPLCDGDDKSGDCVWLDERALDFDYGERVVVDGEPDGGEGAGVDEAETVSERSWLEKWIDGCMLLVGDSRLVGVDGELDEG